MTLNLMLVLYMLQSNPMVGIALCAIYIIILLMTTGTNQLTSTPQPLLCKVEKDKSF